MKSSTIRFFIIWFFFACIYTLLCSILRNNGYLNFETLYLSYHQNNILYNEVNLVKNFFLTYPLLPHILLYPFYLFNALEVPYIGSILYSSLFSTIIIIFILRQKKRSLSFITLLYFICSPILIYSAISGTTTYVYYIGYFLIFYYLFLYVEKFTNYYLTLLSILITLLILLDYHLLWVLLILSVPLFIFSAYSFSKIDANYTVKMLKISQNISLRRKFLGRYGAMLFIIGFLPIVSYFIYLLINYLMGNDMYYFKNQLGNKWNGYPEFNLLDTDNATYFKNRAVNDFSYLKNIALLLPFYVWQVYINRKRSLRLSILLTVPFIVFILLKYKNTDILNLKTYILFLSVSIASMVTYYKNELYAKKVNKSTTFFIYIVVLGISIVGEFYYFKESVFTSEKVFFDAATYHKKHPLLSSYKEAGTFLQKKTFKDAVVLCDPTIMYPLIANNQLHSFFINYQSVRYDLAIQNPQKHCDYIILSKENSPLFNKDNVVADLKKNGNTKQLEIITNQVIYTNKYFDLIEIVK